VLNYFDRTVSTSFVQTDMESEFLLSNVLGPDPKTQRADNLHRYLVDNCGMGAATWDMWVIQGIGNYRNSSAQRQSTGVSAETSAYNIWGWAKGEVDAGKPSMITTTLSGSANVSDWHSLAVYGYWEHSNGSMELLLHNGWPSDIYSSNGVYQVRELWANPSVASFVYRFNYSLNGWHQKFNNPAWYYYENNTVVTTTNIALTRYAGGDRYETAARASQGAFSSSSNVVLASSTSFPDALAAAPLAKQLGAPILLTEASSISPYTIAEIRRLGAGTVYVIGGTAVISDSVVNTLRNSYGRAVVRIGGADRYDTARLIANRLIAMRGAANVTAVFLAIGTDYPDALSAGAAAASRGYPILFAVPGSAALNTYTASIVNSSSIKTAYVIGGTSVIPTGLESKLCSSHGITSVSRYAGSDRYLTNTAVNNAFFPSASTYLYVASGDGFPDALAGGAIAGKYNSPLVITVPNGASLATTTLAYIRAHRPSVMRILGGTNAIDELAEVRLSRIVP
jgi:putative cell wall-binding protein